MLNIPIDEITEADLLDLINNQIAEKRNIEYKIELPSEAYESKKEFLADVSSFANASGGHLIFGMREEGGIPVEIPGLGIINADDQILRLENMLRDNINPRLLGVQIKALKLSSSSVVIIMWIPRSWVKPHVVQHREHWRFYSRNSAGKYPLDVGELRSAFTEEERLSEKIRSFRNVRISSVLSDEMPVNLMKGGRVILHLIPFISFDQAINFPLKDLVDDPWSIPPIYNAAVGHRYNFDGYMTYGEYAGGEAHGYVQIFRNGSIEAVDAGLLSVRGDKRYIPSGIFERKLVTALEKYLQAQKKMLVPTPITLALTLVGVKGFYMATNPELDPFQDYIYPIDKDILLLPEVIIWDYESKPSDLIHPIFDAIWNATGWPKSMNYNDAGEFGKGKNMS